MSTLRCAAAREETAPPDKIILAGRVAAA